MGSFLLHPPTLLSEAEIPPSFAGLGIYVALTIAIIGVFFALVKQGLTSRVFVGWPAQCGEQLYLFIENMCVGTIGSHGRKYIPMIMTFWLLIFTSNFLALFTPTAPTAVLSFNLGLALIAIGYVQYEGIRSNGVVKHFGHFAGPKLPLLMVPVSILLFVVELVSEVMKNVSLSLRLYGNIHGGHEAVLRMNELTSKYFIPAGTFLLPVKLLTVVVQSMIFTLLTCVYISLVTHHEAH